MLKSFTQSDFENFTSREKRYRISDAKGLYLEVLPTGKKIWRYRYRKEGVRTSLTLGDFEFVTLEQARKLRDSLNYLFTQNQLQSRLSVLSSLSQQIMPNTFNHPMTVANTQGPSFSEAYQKFCDFKLTSVNGNKAHWTEDTFKKHDIRFKRYVLPELSALRLDQIRTQHLRALLESIQNSGKLENRDKIYSVLKNLFEYALAKNWVFENPMTSVTKSLFTQKTSTHHAYVTTEAELKAVIRSIEDLKCTPLMKQCIRLNLHFFLRAKELVTLRWSDVNFKARLIEHQTTKSAREQHSKAFLIPLSDQAIELLLALYAQTGQWEFVFGKSPQTHLSPNSINKTIRDNGLNKLIVLHGMSHTASTYLNEHFDGDLVELQLNHAPIEKIRGVYNKAQKLQGRREMMEYWSDYLSRLKDAQN